MKPRLPRQPIFRAGLTDAQRIEGAEWITATIGRLHVSAREQGVNITGDWRVSAHDAAMLLGIPSRSLANYRSRGDGPVYLKAGRRITYGLRDLAIWLWTCRHSSTSHNAT